MTDLDGGAVGVTVDHRTAYSTARPSLAALQTAVGAAETAPGIASLDSDVVVTIQQNGSL